MQILYERSQTKSNFSLVPLRIAGGIVFTLTAKIDLSQEEQYLFNRYRFRDALLVDGDPIVILRKSLRSAIIICLPLWALISYFFAMDVATVVTVFAFAGLTFFYYDKLREHIYVRDLITGRSFQCFSIVELIEKEAYLIGVCGYLRQVLESCKHWGDRETIEIQPLSPDAAKEAVRKAS